MKRKSADPQDDFSKKPKLERTLFQVYCRVRPLSPGESPARFDTSSTSLTLPPDETYSFTQVFTQNSTQEQVYDVLGAPAVAGFLSGRSTLVFAYGITSSGKTHTMLGTRGTPGLIPRVLGELVQTGTKNLLVSFFEIYNEQIYDLLNRRMELKLRQDDISTRIVDLTEFPLTSPSDSAKLLEIGLKERKVSGTALNEVSSRSHSIFTITLKTEFRHTQITIVDLAGAERANRTETAGDRLKEARAINSSLSVLNRCITALKHSQNSHKSDLAPYRESKLTQVLRDFFVNSEAAVTIILNVNPRSTDLDETRAALKFAAIAAEITVRATNKMTSPKDGRQCQALQDELERAKSDLCKAATREHELKSQIAHLEQQLLSIESTTRREVVSELDHVFHEMQSAYSKNIKLLQDINEEIVTSKNEMIRDARRAASEPHAEAAKSQPAKIDAKQHSKKKKKRKKHLPTNSPIANRTRKRLKDPPQSTNPT